LEPDFGREILWSATGAAFLARRLAPKSRYDAKQALLNLFFAGASDTP
jgi:hypothetical protein